MDGDCEVVVRAGATLGSESEAIERRRSRTLDVLNESKLSGEAFFTRLRSRCLGDMNSSDCINTA